MLNTPTNAVAHSLHHLLCSLFLKEYKNDCVFLLIIVKYSEFQKIQHIILLFVTQGLFVVSLGVLQFCIFSLCHYQHLKNLFCQIKGIFPKSWLWHAYLILTGGYLKDIYKTENCRAVCKHWASQKISYLDKTQPDPTTLFPRLM